jgi:hypothetical protein
VIHIMYGDKPLCQAPRVVRDFLYFAYRVNCSGQCQTHTRIPLEAAVSCASDDLAEVSLGRLSIAQGRCPMDAAPYDEEEGL